MKRWYYLLFSAFILLISSCQTTSPKDQNAVRIAYRQAFEKFVKTSFYPTNHLTNTYLSASPQTSHNLIQMTQNIEQLSSKYGITPHTTIIAKRGRDVQLRNQLEKIFVDKFNPLAQEISNNPREMAYLLASSGYAYRYTGFAQSDGNGKKFQKLYIVATIINADCGIFSCFANLEQQVEWKLVEVDETYLSDNKFLRQAQLAANNYEFSQADYYFSLGQKANNNLRVRKEIDRLKADFNRKKKNKISSEKNIASWKKYDETHKGKSNTAILLSGLLKANETMAETNQIIANAQLSTAIATQNAYQTKKINKLTQSQIHNQLIVSDNAYKKQYYALQSMHRAHIEKHALYKIKFNLTNLYQDEQEGKVFRATIDREVGLAEKDYDTKKAQFDKLTSDPLHKKEVDAYINQNPEKLTSLNLRVEGSRIEKRYLELKEDYKHFYIKDKNLYKKSKS